MDHARGHGPCPGLPGFLMFATAETIRNERSGARSLWREFGLRLSLMAGTPVGGCPARCDGRRTATAGPGTAAADRLGARCRGGRLGPPDVVEVGRRPDGGAHRSPLALRRAPERDRCHLQRGAVDLPPIRQPPRGPPNPRAAVGGRPPGHSAKACPWVSASPWPASGSTGCPTGSGCCAASEMAEGSMSEPFEHAAYEGLDNLTAIVDVNRLGQRGETMHGWDLDSYARRAEANGWHAIEIDGHDVEAIDAAYAEALSVVGKPAAIVAKTLKGKGVAAVEDKGGMHGKALDDPKEAIAELGGMRDLSIEVSPPEPGEAHVFDTGPLELPRYDVGDEVATRKAYGEALAALGSADGAVASLDGEVSNSTYAEIFTAAHPERYFEMYIAEQQMVAAAVGMQVRGWKPFASTFAAFLTRAYDFVRMAAVSRASIALCGSHAGVSIGEDGPSQMALEDLAMMRAVGGSTVLYPCDGNQTASLVAAMADLEGIRYLRTTRAATPVLYDPDEEFPVGGSRVL